MDHSQDCTDYIFDNRTRRPLGESNGNAQPCSVPGLTFCAHTSPFSMPSYQGTTHDATTEAHGAMVVASQSAPSDYQSDLREGRVRTRPDWRRHGKNPFYGHDQFRQYRNRQDQKEEKESQKWPPILEDPFLDALLLIPDMGRSKYFMHQSLHGRNMIISTYVWMAYCKSLPPGTQPNLANKRDRKAISSHIQVLKNFFKDHRFYEEQRRCANEDVKSAESLSLKANPVLAALSNGKFPDVRPNYDYFAHLLAQNLTVSVRPKTCWVFVSSPSLNLQEKGTITDDAGKEFDIAKYPQLSTAIEEGESPFRGPDGSLILHEYTNTVSQGYSGPVKEVTKHWEASFPRLYKHLSLPQPQDEDTLTILEMTVSMALHKNSFPLGSELNGLIEMSIEQPALQDHRWKCLTRLVRPRELCADDEPLYLDLSDEMGIQFSHQPKCGERKTRCDCTGRPRQEVRVPFPAAEWASMLTTCVNYPDITPIEGRKRKDYPSRGNGDEESSSREPTQRDLLNQIAMFQELWSAGPPTAHSGAADMGWERRAIIFWKFKDIYQYNARKKKWIAAESPTAQWRFLTVNDPTSEYHLSNAYVASGSVPASRTGFLAPDNLIPHQELKPNVISHGSCLSWNIDSNVTSHLRALEAPAPDFSALGVTNDLATPPMLASSYPADFPSPHELGQPQFGFIHSPCGTPMERQTSSLFGDTAPVTPGSIPFLTENMTMAAAAGIVYDDVICDQGLHAWGTTHPELKAWPLRTEAHLDLSIAPAEKMSDWPVDPAVGQTFWEAAGSKDIWAAPPFQMTLQAEWNDITKNERAGMPAASTVSATSTSVTVATAAYLHESGLAGEKMAKRARVDDVDPGALDGRRKRARKGIRRLTSQV
ncbi:hypothetical protein jhhlp_005184 [Lomentospora prolificans]|uniref:TEA domain-containing protein n=1 Tax=Lomentospora prolificans TaxID=41688 RepID=A0A2N3N785_9PEZI|nr:hypothetical protein jhhlp_005184 [Lomentospora prolificans]